ncbi:MAG: M3 family oligoendopeptidase, partial [Clostridia bacterium]
MIKVSEIKYTRPNKDELLASIEQYKERLINANSAKEFSAIFDQFNEEMEDINTNMEIANIRFTQDTRDEFYQNEKDYLDEISPEISVAITSLSQLVYYSKFRAELEEIYPKVLFTNMELEIKANDERLIEDRIQESKLVTRYTKLMSGIIIDFNGEKLTPAAIKKYFTNPNRELRKSAYEAFGKAIKTNGEEIDDIYDQLVAIRTRMGVTLGYKEGFAPLGYLQMCRNCYDKEDIAKFRANVKKYLVPLCSELHNKIKDSFGWDKVHLYDNEIFTVNEPKPQGTTEEIFDKTASIYKEMSPKTIELFSRMRECECFDVLSREGKWGGGYCTELPKYKLPFILSN